MKPSARSWRIPASTTGIPVRPSCQADQRLRVGPPLLGHRADRLGRQSRVRGGDLVVEVTPAQLPDELLGRPGRPARSAPPPAGTGIRSGGTRSAGRCGRPPVRSWLSGYAPTWPSQALRRWRPATSPPRIGSGDGSLAVPAASSGSSPGSTDGSSASRRGVGETLTPQRLSPHPPVRREDLVRWYHHRRGAAGRAGRRSPQAGRSTTAGPRSHAVRSRASRRRAYGLTSPAIAMPSAPTSPGQPHRLGDRITVADHQVTAALAQGGPQVGQRLGQEPAPVRPGPDRRVEHEQRHHVSAARTAVARAGLSCTRRSRVNSVIAVRTRSAYVPATEPGHEAPAATAPPRGCRPCASAGPGPARPAPRSRARPTSSRIPP